MFFDQRWRLDEEYKKISEKVSNSIKKGFNSEPLYNEKYLKSKIKCYEGKVSKTFNGDGILTECSHCICLSVILIHFVFKIGKKLLSSSVFRRM